MAARSAQATCSTICPVGDSSFADVPIGALWEEEILRWSTTGGLGDVLGGLPPAMAVSTRIISDLSIAFFFFPWIQSSCCMSRGARVCDVCVG